MYRADISLEIMKYFGIWTPKFFLKGADIMYNIFSIVMVVNVYIFTISTLLYLFLSQPDLEDFVESLFYVLALCTACVKIAIVLFKRNEIIELRNILVDEKCYPQDKIEYGIQSKFDKLGRKITIIFLAFASVTIILKATAPLTKGSNAILPYKAWIPYNLENSIIFWLTYFIQAVGSITAGHITIAVDTFIMAMMIALCAQLEILMHRMKKYPEFCLKAKICSDAPRRQEIMLGMWIQHHESMYRFGRNLNSIYNLAFFFQLCASTIDVCTSTYFLTTVNITTVKYWTMVFSLSGIMLQICLYCWPGNVVMEKSRAIGYSVYSADWILLSSSTRINLLHIIRRSEIPIKFTAGKIFPMTIETFTSILRMSFSIYNFLMQS